MRMSPTVLRQAGQDGSSLAGSFVINKYPLAEGQIDMKVVRSSLL